MSKIFQFGEHIPNYDIAVINEREARAGAGILFLFGMISFLNALWLHDFKFTKIFVTFFMIDFFIRIFINPKFSPSLIFGRVFVQFQKPEYVGAPQKRWAWSIGFILSVVMFLLIVIFGIMTPIKIVICLLCLIFLFSESAFGICIGCKLYNFIYPDAAQHCPGGGCEIGVKDDIQKFSFLQIVVLTVALSSAVYATYDAYKEDKIDKNSKPTMKCGVGKCGAGKCGGM